MVVWLLLALLHASVKVAGVEFVPKDLVFAAADPRSRATAEGPLPEECKWEFVTETRIGRHDDAQRCVRYYYKTSVALIRSCPQSKPLRSFSERIISTGPHCPDGTGKIVPPRIESRALSTGTTTDGRHQDIILQPDGTRITLLSDIANAVATAAYSDGTVDTLSIPSK